MTMKSPKTIAAMIAIFFVSFFLFLYLSFPYGVLKEAISSRVQIATGVTVRMESFGPAFPFGFSGTGVEIYKGQSSRVKLRYFAAKLSILQLLMFKLGVNFDLEDEQNGELELGLGFSLFDVLTGRIGLPSSVSMTADKFQLQSLTDFGIQTAVSAGVGGPIAGQLLAKLGIKGKLNGKVNLSLNGKNIPQSTGDLKINFTDALLVLSDPSLNFPDQAFKMAQLTANLSSGTLNIDPTTRFMTEELETGVDGKVVLRAQTSNSDLSLKAFVRLKGLLGEQYGPIIDAFSNGMGKNGSVSLQIAGTLAAPQMNPI